MSKQSQEIDRIDSSGRHVIAPALNSVKNNETTYSMVLTTIDNHDIDVGITVVYEQIDGVSITVDTDIQSDAAQKVIVNAIVDLVSDVFGERITRELFIQWEGKSLLLFIPEQAWE